jgi:carbamoyl-phosphate synthase large subunit
VGVTVLVTGAGGPAGVNVIRALDDDVRVVGVDADPLAVGFRLADESAVIPRADDGGYGDALEEVCVRFGVTALIPTVAEELVALGEVADRLAGGGVRSWLPSADAVRGCVDKWAFARRLAGTDVAAPPTVLGDDGTVPGPWIVKPRWGRGSRDVCPADDVDELAMLIARVPDPIVQTRVEGREFTVDALVDRDGVAVGMVPRWRSETRGGISTKGVTFVDEGVAEGTERLLATLDLLGPANVQGFVGDDGAVTFIEVNPRFSGGLPLALAAGADLVGEYLRAVLGEPIRAERLSFRPGVTMLRYFEEVFEG